MRTIFLTNMVAPYRVDLFNAMKKKSDEVGFDFEVYFMVLSEANRSWRIDLSKINFKHKIWPGIYRMIRGYHFHLNISMLYEIAFSNNHVILGGSWNNINVVIISIMKRLGFFRGKLSIWTEANYQTIGAKKKNKLRDFFRYFVFSSVDGIYIGPGEMTLITLKKWKVPERKFLYLPNLVSDRYSSVPNRKFSEIGGEIKILIVARLEEHLKGIKNFLHALDDSDIKRTEIRIVGDGGSRADYEEYVTNRGLSSCISFLGAMGEEGVLKNYAWADIFVLPSFSDPSPLSVIEACKSGLPLLISERCGNHFEAVRSGYNGFLFDPYSLKSIKDSFNEMVSRRLDWPRFSCASLELANQNFNNKSVLDNFVNVARLL